MKGKIAFGFLVGTIALASAVGWAVPTAMAAETTCGTKENPCPLQKWMRTNMGAASAADDMPALAIALDKAAALSPDASWNGGDPNANWDAVAKAGAAAARAKDTTGVKASCKKCHDLFKAKYKATYRTKPVAG